MKLAHKFVSSEEIFPPKNPALLFPSYFAMKEGNAYEPASAL